MTVKEATLQVAKDLRHLANSIELLAEVPNAEYIPTDDSESTNVAPVVDHGITFENLQDVLSAKATSGLYNEVNNLLRAFGVTTLRDVPYDKYPEMLMAAEEL